jgi:hypothetical protein
MGELQPVEAPPKAAVDLRIKASTIQVTPPTTLAPTKLSYN